MTHKLTQFFIGAAMLAGIATADTDLFAKLSNGAMSDKSEGITELSREQKAKVVGGYIVQRTAFFTGLDGDFTNPRIFQTGIFIRLEPDEIKYFSTLDTKNDRLAMITHYHYNTKGYTNNFYLYSNMTGKMRTLPWNDLLTTIWKKEKEMAQKRNDTLRFVK